jgi:hypothetical protein
MLETTPNLPMLEFTRPMPADGVWRGGEGETRRKGEKENLSHNIANINF